MSEKREVNCDACAADLTYTGNSVDYRVVLGSESLPSRGGAVTAMMVYPPITPTRHFCGIQCLVKWVQTNLVKRTTEAENG